MRRKNLKKGSSLAEMIIVIAVLSIISTIVISFVAMAGESVRTSKQRVDALNDIAIVESIIDSFITSELDSLELTNGKELLNLTVNKGTEINKLSFNEVTNQLIVQKDNIPTTYQSETITKIEILIKKNTNDEKIAMCFITYQLDITSKKQISYSYSFCVNPYEHNDNLNILQGGND